VCTRSGPWAPAAVLHDFLGVSSRNDGIFLEAMRDGCQVAAPVAWVYWAGPRLFGGVYGFFKNR